MKLAIAYKNDLQVRKLVRRVSVLPLVERSAINELWIQIQRDAQNHQGNEQQSRAIQSFINYVVTTWVDEDSALFHRDVWNHWENQGPRTTNHIEGMSQSDAVLLI